MLQVALIRSLPLLLDWSIADSADLNLVVRESRTCVEPHFLAAGDRFPREPLHADTGRTPLDPCRRLPT